MDVVPFTATDEGAIQNAAGVIQRRMLLSCCGCEPDDLRIKVLLDKVLFRYRPSDRSLRTRRQLPADWGDVVTPLGVFIFSEERRASASSMIAQAFLTLLNRLPQSQRRPALVRILKGEVAGNRYDQTRGHAAEVRDVGTELLAAVPRVNGS